MSKRISKTVTLALVLATCIAFLYTTPAQACAPPPPPPKVEIWKKFLSTSDPPPYTMGIEYHWDIEIGVWTSVDLKDAKVSDNFGAELKIDEIITATTTYTFTYLDYETKYPTNQAKVTISDGTTITHKLDWIGVTFGSKPYKFHIEWSGQTHKVHFEWYIGELKAGKTITITIGISTDLNPGGKQEFTSTCEHCINSGAVLKATWRDRCRCRRISAESEQLYVKVQCEVPPPGRLVVKKFHDKNNNGVFDGSDEWITSWGIDVTDPSGDMATYPTPVSLEITEFGLYTITEDLPAEWEQTVVLVDGILQVLDPTTTVTVDSGESHEVVYGNKLSAGRLIIKKFNDKNHNGVFDGTDVWLSSWNIDVEDPSGDLTSYTAVPIDLVITEFGTYTITEAIPAGWVQTALIINGFPQIVNPTAKVTINPGDTYEVHYGNYKPPPPPISISLQVIPISSAVGGTIDFKWTITPPPEVSSVSVILRLTPPVGAPIDIYTGTTFPADLAKTITWIATTPTGTWRVDLIYTYTYLGVTYTLNPYATFTVS